MTTYELNPLRSCSLAVTFKQSFSRFAPILNPVPSTKDATPLPSACTRDGTVTRVLHKLWVQQESTQSEATKTLNLLFILPLVLATDDPACHCPPTGSFKRKFQPLKEQYNYLIVTTAASSALGLQINSSIGKNRKRGTKT